VYCNRCGHENPVGANFCSSCGAALTTATDTTTISFQPEPIPEGDEDVGFDLSSLPPGMAALVVKRGPNAGSRYVLDDQVTQAGRHPDSDIFLDDVTVSRRHASFHRGTGTYEVRDEGSLNGLYVNRERVEQAQLLDGDEVQIGTFKLLFVFPEAR
jgi:pSer/pThr/pTyr-binding forkhead associated (FHA) protein